MKDIIKYIRNFFLCLRYPFWRQRNVWTGKKLSYRNTMYDAIPYGWKKAFGKQLSKDLRSALKKDKILYKAYFHQIKEKYGSLRLYMNFYGNNSSNVVDYYEDLSRCYCIECGKPARYVSQGWIEYYCEECAPKYIKADYLNECRLTEEDIPNKTIMVVSAESGEYTYKERRPLVDFKKMWGIEN